MNDEMGLCFAHDEQHRSSTLPAEVVVGVIVGGSSSTAHRGGEGEAESIFCMVGNIRRPAILEMFFVEVR